MEEVDELCGVCPGHNTQRRPYGLTYQLPGPAIEENQAEEIAEGEEGSCDTDGIKNRMAGSDMRYTGPQEVLRRDRMQEEADDQFEASMRVMIGSCLLCHAKGKPFDHAADTCSRRHDWLRQKKSVLLDCKKESKPWMEKYTACFLCYMPQNNLPQGRSRRM